jgi:hypothetical protein
VIPSKRWTRLEQILAGQFPVITVMKSEMFAAGTRPAAVISKT